MEEIFTIFNERIKLDITNYGGRVMRWIVDSTDIVFGFDTVEKYKLANEPYHSALIGRYSNRIANARYSHDDNSYRLNNNLGAHILHGGDSAFHNVIWTVISKSDSHIELQYISKDGDQGFPGQLITTATYTLVDDEVLLVMKAKTTKSTPVSFTHHPYFNLSGLGRNSLENHNFKIHSNTILTTDQNGIPSGEKLEISGTAFDFVNWRSLSHSMKEGHPQIDLLGGIDHSYIFDSNHNLQLQAEAQSKDSKIHMMIFSNQPAIQFYTANHFNSSDQGKNSRLHAHRGAFCFEPQQWPDSPNHDNFPNTILDPSKEFLFSMKYKFPPS